MRFFDFIEQIGGYEHGDELIDLMEHEPPVGGWFGVDPQTHAEYVAEIDRIIDQLDSET